ncbi:MAG: KdsC family phosphatase [Thermodesulfobacteriota bacterium]
MAVIGDELRRKIEGVRLVIFDVDGVLTDGLLIYDDRGVESKSFDVRDGHGIKLLMRTGIEVAIITARESKVVEHRAANLGIELVFQGAKRKIEAFDAVLERLGLAPEQAAYMGDDIIDLPVMRRAGFAATVPDAVDLVLERADYVSTRPGGRGAAREVCELILKAQGRWDEVVAPYLL